MVISFPNVPFRRVGRYKVNILWLTAAKPEGSLFKHSNRMCMCCPAIPLMVTPEENTAEAAL